MTVTLIILAHPERRSFNGAWAEATERASVTLGHEVIWSDLCGMGFDPVERSAHFSHLDPDAPFDALKAQETASASNTLPVDVAAEVEKVRRADRLIFHFPLWWFSPPAILKGWCERALVHGALHTVARRFDTGLCKRKRALFCVTTGSTDAESAHNGKEGDVRLLLWPLASTLRYLGMTVLQPKIVHGVHGYHRGEREAALQARLSSELDAHGDLISAFDEQPTMTFNPDTDFDDDGRLRPEANSHSAFIRHTA